MFKKFFAFSSLLLSLSVDAVLLYQGPLANITMSSSKGCSYSWENVSELDVNPYDFEPGIYHVSSCRYLTSDKLFPVYQDLSTIVVDPVCPSEGCWFLDKKYISNPMVDDYSEVNSEDLSPVTFVYSGNGLPVVESRSFASEWQIPAMDARTVNEDSLLEGDSICSEADLKIKIDEAWNETCKDNHQFQRLGEGADDSIPFRDCRASQRSKLWDRNDVKLLYSDLLPEALELFQHDFNQEKMTAFHNKIEEFLSKKDVNFLYQKIAFARSLGVGGIPLRGRGTNLVEAKNASLFPDISFGGRNRGIIFIIYDPYNSILLRKEVRKEDSEGVWSIVRRESY